MNYHTLTSNYINNPAWRKWLITFTVMIVAIIDMIDMTIVNVTLPHMMGSLSANADQITWVLTCYVVASAICMPLTGFLTARVGRKRLLFILISGFTVSSILCGCAWSLEVMVFCRALQGMFGAGLIPLSQSILRDTFPESEQGRAMAIWGVGMMVAPIFGPVLGGYITQVLHWRWIFYINIPVGCIALVLTLIFIDETTTHKTAIDWFGIILFAIGIGSLQVILDRGNHLDWFDSAFIQISSLICLATLATFITRSLKYDSTIIDFSLFKDRNFTISCLLVSTFCFGFYAAVALLPLEMEELMHFPADLAGLLLAPRGIASAITMMILGNFVTRFDTRVMILSGICLTAISSYMLCQINLHSNMQTLLLLPNIIQGIGIGLFFLPTSTMALSAFTEQKAANASGVFNFFRHLGGSIGIAVLSSELSYRQQWQWHHMVEHLSRYALGSDIVNHEVYVKNYRLLHAKSYIAAFNECFFLLAILSLCLAPIVLLIKSKKNKC